jgi:hypothetical protein
MHVINTHTTVSANNNVRATVDLRMPSPLVPPAVENIHRRCSVSFSFLKDFTALAEGFAPSMH